MNADRARLIGLKLATELHAAIGLPLGNYGPVESIPACVLETAGEFARWLTEPPHRLHLRPAPFTFQQPDYPGPAVHTKTGDHGMSVTMTDSQEVSYSVAADDSKGFPVADTFTWSSDDGGAVLTVTPSADGTSCVFAAVAPGSATISVTDGTLSASDLITVTTGAVATLVLTPGTPTDEPAGP